MFRAAFPNATDDMERAEANWVKNNFDIAGANKSGKARFAGTWVTPEVALTIADSYQLAPVITPLVLTNPDPNAVYRKSTKQGPETPGGTPGTAVSASPTKEPATKRRREASPSPTKGAAQATPTSQRATSPRLAAQSTPTRRSARLRSPAPPPMAALTAKSPKTPRTKQIQEQARAPDESVGEDEIIEISKAAMPSMEEDVREQRELIERLKAQKATQAKVPVRDVGIGGEATLVLAESTITATSAASSKRLREEESVEIRLNIKEPETEERALVSNSRIRSLRDMPPERKSLAWGALFFAAGMGAM